MAFDYDLDVTAENVIRNLNQMAHNPARDAEKFRKWAAGKIGITFRESRSMRTPPVAKPAPKPATTAKTARKGVFSRKKSAGKTSDPKKPDA